MSIFHTLIFILQFPSRKLKHVRDLRVISNANGLQERFTLIFERNAWGSGESASGLGSTIEMTISVRTLLPVLLERFAIKSIFDAPCGDFNWMKDVDLRQIKYIGGDIVESMIHDLNTDFATPLMAFVHTDITRDSFPESDLVLNRDCLFHLSYEDILLTLGRFLESGSQYFLSTSHVNEIEFVNSNIESGGFRLLDLFSEPFKFSRDSYFEIPEDVKGSTPARKLYLWDRTQVEAAYLSLDIFLK